MSGSLGQGYYRGDIAGSYATSSQPNYVEPQSCHAATFLGRDFAAFGSLGQSDTVATVWNVRDQKLAWQLDGHRDGVTCLAASADGSIIATGSYDKTVRYASAVVLTNDATIKGALLVWGRAGVRFA